jgi:hypothetical protein
MNNTHRFGLVPLWVALALLAPGLHASANTNLSVWAFPGSNNRLISEPDAKGNRIIDYSGVGYKAGIAPLPVVPVKVTISPVAGDNVANIQNAINQVSAMPLDVNGLRGAVQLNPGVYPLSNTITISASGVVLRGSGNTTNGTVLRATATNQYTLVEITGSGSASTVSGTTHNITNNYVPVGARSFFVDSASGLSVGDHVFVRRVATTNWIHDLGMDLLGPAPVVPWAPSGYNIDSDRIITHLEGNQVFVDWPIACAIDRNYTNGTIRKFTWSGRIQNSGVEHLYGISDYFGNTTNENHGWTFIQFDKIENGWARDVTSQYFGYSCVSLNSGAKWVTVADCRSLDPISIVTGGRRYAFVINDCQLCLFKNCYTREDRHQFVTQSLTIGPSAFVDGTSDNAHAEAGPHQRWATGILWDNITVNGNYLDAQNAGNYGTGHGWEGATCVIWNSAASGFIVQNPPGARNWLIGSVGPIKNGTAYVGPHDPGTYDSSGTNGVNVFPDSIYYAQLQDRLQAPNRQTHDYWLGDIDAFTNGMGPDVVPVDAGWRAAVQAAAAGEPMDAFDVVATGHWVPFTFNFALATNEQVVAATLSISLLATGGNGSNCVLHLNGTTNPLPLATLGWLPLSTAVTNPSVRLLDLSGQLTLLAGGQLNVALLGDAGIDWAMLEIQVAPVVTAVTNSLEPVADSYVQGGTSADINFGTNTTLLVKEDTSINVERKAYLRWDLSSISAPVLQARVRLVPVSVGTNGLEHGITLANSNSWNENSITWSNQPGGGKRFATWMPTAGLPVEFSVTPQVVDALAGDKQLSLELFSLRPAGGAGLVSYAAREYSDPASRPQLLFTIPAPPTNSGGFFDADIGGVSPPGSSSYSAGTLTVNGGGGDIWSTADQFHFSYLPLTNTYCHVIARVSSLQPVDAWTKCGVMLRASFDTGAAHAMTVITPSNGVNFFYRSATDGTTTDVKVAGPTAPSFLAIARSGNNFTSWYSSDGANWAQIGTPQNIPMSANVYAGFCLSSHVVGTLATGTLDHLAVGPLAQPVLSSSLAPDNQFTLQVSGDVGPAYFIQSSIDLQTWSTALTNRPTSFPFTWTTTAAGAGQFYRVVLGP